MTAPKTTIIGAARRMARSEDGTITIFALYLILIMMVLGGIGVDFMRNEMDRTHLQHTLDRAILAAADLDQTLEPQEVVEDYFAKTGMSEFLVSTQITEGLNYRKVEASARRSTDTQFIHMLGIETLTAPAAGAAEERIPNVEISLVLDISGSMRFDDRISDLRVAAHDFLGIVLSPQHEDNTSVNLIPYAGMTNPGPAVFSYLAANRYPTDVDGDTVDDIPQISSCVEFNNGDFNTSALPTNKTQVPHFMYWDIAASVMDWGWCPADGQSIIYASNNLTDLQNRVMTMRMHDGTGTHFAMKWALALLDPDQQPLFAHLSGLGIVPTGFNDRPVAYNVANTSKYIVLMTDGKITDQWRPSEPLNPINATTELQFQDSSKRTKISSASTNVSRFYSQCNLAKANGIVVFTIAYEAPSGAETEMRNCASSPAHFFKASKLDIGNTFRLIAYQINQLRLTL